MSTKFFTNKSDENSLFRKFEGILSHNDIHFFEALVGYFRSSGYFKIQGLLKDVPKVRILVGINVDQLSAQFAQKGQMYFEDQELTKESFLNDLNADIQTANYEADIEKGILQFIEDIVSGKLEIKASGAQKIHAKIYIFRPENFNQHSDGHVITGSSNLSDAGLGTSAIPNYEFNVLLKDFDNVKFALDEFEELWAHAVPILPVDIQSVKKQSHFQPISPYQLYIKMLIEYFGKAIDNLDVMDEAMPEGYADLEYQKDAVYEGFSKLIEHNGFILADVVGLGKTVIATRVIKKYIQRNGYKTKVLVVHPPALESNWKTTIRDFELRNFVDFVTNGSLHKVIDPDNYHYLNPEEYDLIVVDESHKYRNTSSNQYALLEIICKTPRRNIGGDSNSKKKVMLLSATPINNKPDDIANQIYLFQDARHSTIPGQSNLQTFFAPRIKDYKELHKIKNHTELVQKVQNIYGPIRDEIFRHVVIRRTRKDIMNISRYAQDVSKQGMTFPTVNDPQSVHYVFDDQLNELFYESVNTLTDELGYMRYRAIEFINPEFQELYDNAKLISTQLAGIMKTQLVKRLESSFFAFKNSLFRFQKSNQRMIEMFENDTVYIAPDLDINKLYDEGREDEIEQLIDEMNEESPNNAIYSADDFDPNFIIRLREDQKLIDQMVSQWSNIEYDPKWDTFQSNLSSLFLNKNNPEGKLVIFSESKETVQYLKEKLADIGRKDVLAIDSSNQRAKFKQVQNNFDANISTSKQKHNYNIVITTEVLAEGINLHRSNVVLNYDIPWNATKLMQRIGRVNRLGTQADEIYVYNFYPTAQSNEQIELNQKALKKLQGFHTAFGEDSKIYSQQEELIDNILGNLNEAQEETSETMKRLDEIRTFKENKPSEFDAIKALPLKSRTARLATVKNQWVKNRFGQELGEAVLCYIRNAHKDAFFLVTDGKPQEITFSDAVYIFEAQESEKAESIPEWHYDAVKKALIQFETETQFNWFSENDIDRSNLSVQEKNAIDLLSAMEEIRNRHNPELYTDEFQNLLETAKNALYKGVFRKLRNEIARLAREQKKQNFSNQEVVTRLYDIFDRYPLQSLAKLEELRKKASRTIHKSAKPQIVLTETFF